MQQARKVLHGLADQAGQAMARAADALERRNPTAAIAAQTEALPPLNQLFELLGPFEAILQAAIKSETALVETSTRATGGEATDAATGNATGPTSTATPPDVDAAVEDQQFVSGWSRMLVRKAEQLLAEADAAALPAGGAAPTFNAAPSAGEPTEIPLPTNPENQTPPSTNPQAPSASEPEASAAPDAPATPPADPRAAYEKAIELGPRIIKLTSDAASDLRQQAWSAALPKQEEALKLLKEIAALLPQQPQDNEQEQQDKEQQDKEQQDKEQQDKEKQDKEKQDQEKQDQEKQDQEKQEKSPDEEQKKKQDDADKQKSDQENSPEQQESPENMSRQQAESLLRQVREREREHREFEKEIRRLLQSRIIVEKDW